MKYTALVATLSLLSLSFTHPVLQATTQWMNSPLSLSEIIVSNFNGIAFIQSNNNRNTCNFVVFSSIYLLYLSKFKIRMCKCIHFLLPNAWFDPVFLFIYFYLYSINQCFASLCLRPMIVYIYSYKSLNFVKYNHYKNTFLENMRNLFNSSPHFVTLLAQNNTMLFCSAVVFSLFLSSSLDFYENIFIVVCLFFLLQFFRI